MTKDIDIIIISYNCSALTLKCIESVFATYQAARVTIVDNASTDKSPEIIRKGFPDIQIIENKENRGYAGAVNIGMNATNAEFAIISNADVEFFKNSIELLKNVLKDNPRIGAAGPQQVYPDGRWQWSYGNAPGIKEAFVEISMVRYVGLAFKRVLWKKGFRSKKTFKDVEYIDGAVIAVKREAFKSVGGFDENFFFYAEEADFCLRLQKNGWKVVHVPNAILMHHRGGSSTKLNVNSRFYSLLVESKMKLARKHFPDLANLYARLQYLHSYQMVIVANIARIVSLGYFNTSAGDIFTIQKNIWKKELNR